MKKKYLFRSLGLLLLAIALLSGWLAPSAALARAEFKQAPANPEFIEAMERLASQDAAAKDSQKLGFIPSPVTIGDGAQPSVQGFSDPLPASYNTGLTQYQTPVKDQMVSGPCWAFASLAAMESYIKRNGGADADFSERNMMNTHGFDLDYTEGGNRMIAMAYLARWSGPLNETDDYAFNPPSAATVGDRPDLARRHVQDTMYILGGDYVNMKRAIREYGAVYSAFYWNAAYFNDTYDAFYCPSDETANHAVAIVGWDDNFPKARFNTQPASDGAFIVKNSWGTSWGSSGYFYISYEDLSFGKENYAFTRVDSAANYGKVYQYDPLGWVSSYGCGTNTAWFSNVFPAPSAAENVRAVSFYTTKPGAAYEVYIAPNVSGVPPSFSGATPVATGTQAFAGFHTVDIASTPVSPSAGFAVAVKVVNPSGSTFPVAGEYAYTGYTSGAAASPGQSFLSTNGVSWTDATTIESSMNVCLKAYTTSTSSVPVTGVTLNKTSLQLAVGNTCQLTATVSPANATNKNVTWASSKPSVATVSASGLVTAVGAGSATITVTTQSGGKTAACAVTVGVPVTGVTLNKTSWQINKGKTYQLTATVSPASASNKTVTWSSSNAAVATVSASGLVTGKKTGSATITVTTADGGKTAKCAIKVVSATQVCNLAASKIAKTSFRLSWSKLNASGTVRYYVYQATSKSGTYKKVADTGSTYKDIKNLTNGKSYYYKVRAKVGSKYKEYSTYLKVTVIPATQVRNLKATNIKKTCFRLSWSKLDVSGSVRYYVYQATSKSGTYKKITSTTLLYKDIKSLKKGKTYYYKVRAKVGSKYKEYSLALKVTMKK